MASSESIRKRSAHTKSRKGCLQCKRRRRKCDEEHPCCGDCRRLRTSCSFETGPSSLHASPSNSLPTPGSGRSAADTESRSLELQDLELYSDFLLYSMTKPFGGLESTPEMMNQLNKLVLSKPYLLHVVLAVSAAKFYLADTSRRELISRASFLQSTALSLANPLCNFLSEEESIGMLFFSGFTAIYSFAEVCFSSEDNSFDLVQRLLQSFHLVRGIRLLLHPHWQYINSSWAGPLLQASMDIGHHERTLAETSPGYRSLRSMAMGLEDNEERSGCLKAIDCIFKYIDILSRTKEDRLANRLILTWPLDIESVLDSLLKQGKPIAFILLAHYAALLHCGRQLWWVSKWPELILDHIDTVLGDEWAEFVAWPKEIVYGADSQESTG